jgi:hypothetical protein
LLGDFSSAVSLNPDGLLSVEKAEIDLSNFKGCKNGRPPVLKNLATSPSKFQPVKNTRVNFPEPL